MTTDGPTSEQGRGAERPSDPSTAPLDRGESVVVAGALAPDDPADRWLVFLRWVATFGMGVTIFIADRLIQGLAIRAMFAVLLGIAASNLAWMAILFRSSVQARKEISLHERPEGRRWVEVQLATDVMLLTLMLWFAGGVSNPFASFLVFQIALSGLLSTPRATIGVAALTFLAALVLVWAPPLPELTPRLHTIATVVALTSMSSLLAAFFAVYARRLDRLRGESNRNEKLAVLGRLVGSMSHELNTPLATILLSSKDLERYGDEMPPLEAKQLVSSIAREAERANEIIGLVRGHVGPDQIVETVELVEDLAREELDRLGFEGERRFEIEGEIQAPIMKRALVQLLVNVLRNATEASLLRRRRRITVSVAQVGGRAEIRVEDRGPGFEPEILARLGEPFQTTKQKEGGMGLGLYVSALLAKQMGSELRVQSAQGGGARVSVSLDLDERRKQRP
jgi:two-component system sensor histidine kinase RegB